MKTKHGSPFLRSSKNGTTMLTNTELTSVTSKMVGTMLNNNAERTKLMPLESGERVRWKKRWNKVPMIRKYKKNIAASTQLLVAANDLLNTRNKEHSSRKQLKQ